MSAFVVQLLMSLALLVVGDNSSVAHPDSKPEPEERLEGWLAVTNNLTVHVAVGLLNRAEARPAALCVDGLCVCTRVCEHAVLVGIVKQILSWSPSGSPRNSTDVAGLLDLLLACRRRRRRHGCPPVSFQAHHRGLELQRGVDGAGAPVRPRGQPNRLPQRDRR